MNEETKKREDFIKKLLVTLIEHQENSEWTQIHKKEDKTA